MSAIRLYRVILPVGDIGEAARFYGAVLGTPGERVSPGRHYFTCGSTILACYDPAADGDPPGEGWRFHDHQYLYFAVPDLEAVRERVAGAGGVDPTPIATMPWGERLFYAGDPFGGRVCFVDETTLFTGGPPAPEPRVAAGAEPTTVRRLEVGDAAALVALRREALEDAPLAFAASPEDDRGLVLERVRDSLSHRDRSVVFGLFDGSGGLAGMVGLARDDLLKRAHRALVWGLYVSPRARGLGGARRLMAAAIDHARGWPGVAQVALSVTEPAADALALYRSLGFVEWGREPGALRWRGRVVDEIHLLRVL
jgi:GNAT superfamily N-acetyltransferase/predicted enzyme related to lactoylglutathione lyase